MRNKVVCLAALAAAVALDGLAGERLSVDELFSDGMVFAENRPLRVFGRGEGEVEVRIGGLAAKARAEGGRWVAELPKAPRAGNVYELEVVMGGERKAFRNVRIGEVWLMAGQSNMQFKLKSEAEYPGNAADDGDIAYFNCARQESEKDATGGWRTATADGVGEWSAVGWLFARGRKRLNGGRPVGIVGCNQGASTVQAWLPAAVATEARYALPREELHADHFSEAYFWNKPGLLYESMFKKVTPFAFTGVVWYQGESNTGKGEYKVYPELLSRMIDVWRADLRDPDLPFVLVRIADYDWRRDDGWRNIQKALESMPSRRRNVVCVPCPVRDEDVKDIHPPAKGELARRLAEAADACRR